MSTLFDDLKQGLQEAIAYEKGQGTARIKTYTKGSGSHQTLNQTVQTTYSSKHKTAVQIRRIHSQR